MKDYYKILGVSPDASGDEIKRAFKILAKKFHPDANKNYRDAEAKFKEISEAYDVIGKPSSRSDYDMQRSAECVGGFSQGSIFSDSDFSSESLEDLLRGFAGGRKGRFRSGFGRDFTSASGGFENHFSEEQAEPQAAKLRVPLKIACQGGQIQVSGLPGGPRRVEIPANITNGHKLSVPTSEGPFILELAVEDSPPFIIRGNDIETTISLNLAQAVLGCKVKLRDPRETDLILTIPPGSQPNDILRLRGLGLGSGVLLVRLTIQVPRNLSEQDKELFRQFAESHKLKF